jgi:cytoskeletal protein CcmA (bactofilin family)
MNITKFYDKMTSSIDNIKLRNSTVPSVLSETISIEGKINSSGIIEIEGFVKGEAIAKSIIIRQKGSYDGNIIADTIDIYGNFNGTLTVKNIRIFNKAIIKGNFIYESLYVEDGASIEGEFSKKEFADSKKLSKK